jgi:Domain of unknown function (DUF5916)
MFRWKAIVGLASCCLALLSSSPGQPGPPKTSPAKFAPLRIPHLEKGPTLTDFFGMRPSPAFAGKMLKIEGFVQRDPHDGAPISQKTEAYLGYTDKNLYVVCVCFDSEPRKMRSRRSRREDINNDDQFGFVLDTFHDKKNGLFFYLNPAGTQQDGIWNDQSPSLSYDMVWNSQTKITGQGYIAWFEVPFRSLRFPASQEQLWGIFLERDIKRNNEFAFYPHITSNAQGFMSQDADLTGLREIVPARNMQFNPYASFRTFRGLDDRDPNHAFFDGKHIEPRLGLDSKIVIKNALVLDATINPDFSQVESDEPQVTVNQRFEVFFPEKRPFFLENSAYFDTPINLVFTRRIADPEYGVRLTGKLGPWSVATLVADDKSPGKSVPADDLLADTRAYFGVLRINRDIGKESTIGIIYTDREMHTVPSTVCSDTDDDSPCRVAFNRVGGVDAKLRFGSKWLATAQAVVSSTRLNDGTYKAGPAFDYYLERSSRDLEYNVLYRDTSPGFQTDTGFFRRPDERRLSHFLQYRIRKKDGFLQWQGPSIFAYNNWDHEGRRLEWFTNLNYRWQFQRATQFGFYGNLGHELLRKTDYPDTLTADHDYAHHHVGAFFDFGYFKPVLAGAELNFGTDTNYDPAVGPPVLARSGFAQAYLTVRPKNGLTIENTYLLTRLYSLNDNRGIFTNHIIRSKWNYQFTREFSLRVIGEYDTVLANHVPGDPAHSLTSLQTTKNFNADVLFTYLVHPGTAVYVGYNTNLQNLDPSLALDPEGNLARSPNHFINDGRQFFVKMSYLFRF